MEKFLSRALKNDLLMKSEKINTLLQREHNLQYSLCWAHFPTILAIHFCIPKNNNIISLFTNCFFWVRFFNSPIASKHNFTNSPWVKVHVTCPIHRDWVWSSNIEVSLSTRSQVMIKQMWTSGYQKSWLILPKCACYVGIAGQWRL